MFNRLITDDLLEQINDRPAVTLVGPRQVGKTTLIQSLTNQFKSEPVYLDLESLEDLNRL